MPWDGLQGLIDLRDYIQAQFDDLTIGQPWYRPGIWQRYHPGVTPAVPPDVLLPDGYTGYVMPWPRGDYS